MIWFVHLVKHSAENILEFPPPLYHWGTEINSLTISKSLKYFLCLGVKQLCRQDFYDC